MNIDAAKFFAGYRDKFGSLNQSQVDGLNQFLGFIQADPYVTDTRYAGYMIATAMHETAGTFKPIHEYGSRKYFVQRYGGQTPLGKRLGNDTPEEGADYAGRGYPQTTGEANYEKAEDKIRAEYPDVVAQFEARTGRKFDLTVGDQPNDESDPDNMLDPEIAYCAMSSAMREGWFTGKKLSDYLTPTRTDYIGARKIINGTDKAEHIAALAICFEAILNDSIEVSQ